MATQMFSCDVMVGDRPYCIWDDELKENNLRFLDGIDASFYRRAVEQQADALEGDQRLLAAMYIRLLYSQALETFLSFVAAAIQSPFCPLAYVSLYTAGDLRTVVEKLHYGSRIPTPLQLKPGWVAATEEVLCFKLEDREKEARIKSAFASM
jgi:hypothetical protein